MTSEENPRTHLGKEPCSRCNWSPDPKGDSGYKSNVKFVSEAGTDGIWTLGDKYILRDRNKVYASNDPDNHEFVRRNTSIPVPKIPAYWEQPGDRCMMIEEVIENKNSTLERLWPTLSESDRKDIAQQTAKYLEQLRSHTSDKIQGINGGPVYWNNLFRDHDPKLPASMHGPYESEDEVFEAMTGHLKRKGLPDKILATIRKHLGPIKPYTFTHTNLGWGSIILREKKVVGIADWQFAAYLPRWAEWVYAQGSHLRGNKPEEELPDQEWRHYLVESLGEYDNVESTLYLIDNLDNYPELGEKQREMLEMVEAVADREADQENTELVTEEIARIL